ncbi:MAG: carbamoyl phosphate synthase small subunit [Treponema sp. CETP13]|nr:MAG: carbamoyl phosphate synthase small subunit [Treponema sp. CETP13]
MSNNAYLVLENGHVFEGKSFGASGCVTGEAVFTTGMTGYLETLTDPSYYGQIVVQTFPLIGNYGVIPADFESEKPHVRGYIVREKCDTPSNFRCPTDKFGTLDNFLKTNNIIGLYGIDTRQLTKIIRESGVMNARIFSLSGDKKKDEAILSELKHPDFEKIKSYTIKDAVNSVTLNADKVEKTAAEVFTESAQYRAVPVTADGLKINDPKKAMERGIKLDGTKKRIVLWDFGAKANIRRELLKRGVEVITVAANSKAEDILKLKPDGVMLSNGPGDPEENTGIIKELATLCKQKTLPIFGICLGHQLLALAMGGKTEKLKYGHRGGNQPVKNLETNRVYISSQNHGYAVSNNGLPANSKPFFINVNDETNEGLRYQNINAFTVQFHPEASSGPLDTGFLFDDFVKMIGA